MPQSEVLKDKLSVGMEVAGNTSILDPKWKIRKQNYFE